MPSVTATDRPMFWAVGEPVIASDMMKAGGVVVTGLTLASDEDENTFLGLVSGKAGTHNPLPDVGEPVESGQIYSYNAGLVICRQSHIRTIYAPEATPALFAVYRAEGGLLEWVAGEQVQIGTQRDHDGTTYSATQDHQTQIGWEPPNVPALWAVVVVVPPAGVWTAGVAYAVDDEATYNGNLYRCRQAHTSIGGWEPPNVPALWLAL